MLVRIQVEYVQWVRALSLVPPLRAGEGVVALGGGWVNALAAWQGGGAWTGIEGQVFLLVWQADLLVYLLASPVELEETLLVEAMYQSDEQIG